MKKKTALKIYPTASQLATALGITQQAVSKWPDEVPRRHVERLRELRSASKAERAKFLETAPRSAAMAGAAVQP